MRLSTHYFTLHVDKFELTEEGIIIAYQQGKHVLDIVCLTEQTFETIRLTQGDYKMFVDYVNNTKDNTVNLKEFKFNQGNIFYELHEAVII